ncbi:MAG TPA: DUF6056 family protein [Kofleriaceae bacterium]|nr:DUF6056 family protein [Kofleriaceae bacterium]
MPTRRDRIVFLATCGAMWSFFAFICSYSPVLLDDWYQVVYWKQHPFTLGSIWHNGVYNYFHYNPRLGENILLIVNGPRWIYLAMTPAMEMLVVFTLFAYVQRRWPRMTAADALRVFVAFMILWLSMPVPGIMWFYRPFNTNYVYGFELTLLLFVPYYFTLLRPGTAYRDRTLAPALFLLGFAAGMTNEHTGPTAILAMLCVLYLLRRKLGALRRWMWAGAAGLLLGYPALFFAPGQSERYGGIINRMGPLDWARDRGVSGALMILRSFVWEGQVTLYIVAGAVLLAFRKRAGQSPPRFSTDQLATMAFLTVAAFLIVLTLLGSPSWGERLFFASAVLFTIAVLIVIDAMIVVRGARIFVLCMCLGLGLYHAVRLCMIYPTEYKQSVARQEAMASAPPGGTAMIKPYTYGRSPWLNADDFGYASLREEVAHEMYGITKIEYDRPTRAEPTAPYSIELEYQFDPPVPKAEVERTVTFPLSFVPSYVDRDIQFIRRVTPQLRTKFPGHTFKGVVGRVVGFDQPEWRGRPLIAIKYDNVDDKFQMIDVRSMTEYDDLGRNYWLVWDKGMPPGLDESYLISCGTTKRQLLHEAPDGRGWRVTVSFECRGRYTQVMCGKDECWLGGIGFR